MWNNTAVRIQCITQNRAENMRKHIKNICLFVGICSVPCFSGGYSAVASGLLQLMVAGLLFVMQSLHQMLIRSWPILKKSEGPLLPVLVGWGVDPHAISKSLTFFLYEKQSHKILNEKENWNCWCLTNIFSAMLIICYIWYHIFHSLKSYQWLQQLWRENLGNLALDTCKSGISLCVK